MVDFNNFFNNRKRLCIAGGIIIIIITVVGCIIYEQCNHREDESFVAVNAIVTEVGQNGQQNADRKNKNVIVHIMGEVNNPGILELPEGSRLKDVIEMAGGLTEQANIFKVNLAYIVQDGQKIIIPNLNEKSTEIAVIDDSENFIADNPTTSGGKININTATQSELESITGVGPSMASKILQYRKEHGKFKNVEEIKNVSGIGNAKYESIKTEICVK